MDYYSLRCMFVVMVFTFTTALPPDYCLMPANLSDCGMKPTAIFSFYLPGSRCELEIWRGCPTLNKFSDQYECIDHCIYHYKQFGIAQDEAYHIKLAEHAEDYGNDDVSKGPIKASTQVSTPPPLPARCRVDLNTNLCSDQESGKTVYTYNTETGECEETTWYHCSPAENQFESPWKCENTCLNAQSDWKNQLTHLVNDDAEDLDTAIEDVIQNLDHGDESEKGNNSQSGVKEGNKGNGDDKKDNGGSDKDGHKSNDDKNGIKSDEDQKNDDDIIHNDINGSQIDNDHNNISGNEHEGSNSVQNGAVDNDTLDVDEEEINEDEESGPNDSGEPNYTQVNFATTEVQKFKKNMENSLVARSKRLMAFFGDNKDDYIN